MTWTGDPIWLEQVLREAGLSVSVHPGALDRGHGDMGTLWGAMLHHTGAPVGSNPGPGAIANHPSLGLAAQLHISRSGHWTVCGVGIAYHAGQGSYPGLPTNNANPIVVGVEAENSGTEGWSSAQYWSYVRGVAAINRRAGRDSSRAIGHKEWAAIQGKWDPGGMDMGKLRADVGNMIAELNGVKPDVPVIENQIDRVRFFSDWLGKRLHDGEKPCKDGVGRYADFENGSIYWHPDTGAVPIPKLVYEVWAARGWEIEYLGYPQRFHVVYENEGDLQSFQGGTIARRYGTPGFVCHGVIGRRWIEEGGVRDVDGKPTTLGWPTSDEYDFDGGRRQDFEHGSLLWHPSGAIEITGDNR
ncbi:N-acetylmuramoyl-L-alanine amidase [Rhodococcus sp. IEGM 1318]|uniref:N-acetylmuramoyl-L-alanine amidase n=1 Tax=Rhodococcus sp. IEGM 1318 TaxID=3082226 RepID=UPI002952A2C2|nr:N-acetylmuramoyl-L-alanine amidase [Rhodococcus sp. IEGM 1318]MDV8006738.1 N-acetylmuramoyl-L-alanine amidase [Rhodococcus sp. IEGM 1318]